MRQTKRAVTLFLLLCVGFGGSQWILAEARKIEGEEPPQTSLPLPKGYREFRFGLTFSQVIQKLKSDPFFSFIESEVTMEEEPNQALIDSDGNGWIKRGFFQFTPEQELYIILLKLNRERLDFFTLFSALRKKYGEPTTVNPSRIQWISPEVLLSLERPLAIKYIDRQRFEKLQEESQRGFDYRAISSEEFLDGL